MKVMSPAIANTARVFLELSVAAGSKVYVLNMLEDDSDLLFFHSLNTL